MSHKLPGTLRVGTSNIVLPGNKSTFPATFPDKSRLNYYSSLFNSLEVNSSFYKIPLLSTCKKWADDVGQDFRFTVKLWRGITHAKALDFNRADIDLFLQRTAAFGDKKGCLLLQFPGKTTLTYFSKVEEILSVLSQSPLSHGWKMVLEFRDSSWYTGETFELLDEHGASMVLHDNPKAKNEQSNKNARVIYLRFHGPKGDYAGSYSLDFLSAKTNHIKEWIKQGKDVYAYFNNTIGSAFDNARTLQELHGVNHRQSFSSR